MLGLEIDQMRQMAELQEKNPLVEGTGKPEQDYVQDVLFKWSHRGPIVDRLMTSVASERNACLVLCVTSERLQWQSQSYSKRLTNNSPQPNARACPTPSINARKRAEGSVTSATPLYWSDEN